MSLIFHHITFAFDGAATPLLQDLSVHLPKGWTGIVGANGTGKTTLLRLASGELRPQQGSISRPEHMVFCPQRTDYAPLQLEDFIAATDAQACVLRGKLQVGEDWPQRWPTLSHGERKRAQIATAVWQQPDMLLIDEPTNHIDDAARVLLAEALQSFHGIGLLVSHDRELLDLLCRQCLFIDPPQALLRPGNYTQACAEARREAAGLIPRRRAARQQLEHLTRAAKRRQSEADRADRKRSKRGLARGDSDGRAKIDHARICGKDGQAGRLANQLKGRLEHMQEALADLPVKKRYALNFWLEGSASPKQRLFSVPPTAVDLDVSRRLVIPALTMLRHDRIAVTGPNGSGKSTLIRHILKILTLPEEHLIYVPQEIDMAATRGIMEMVQKLSRDQLGQVMTVVSALGSRPERLLHNLEVSPGELRKVLLALGVIRRPHLIIMDEPTNHLDLPAIECLEKALCDCPCGLLLVSHDLCFLSGITHTRWHLQQKGNEVRISTNETHAKETGRPL